MENTITINGVEYAKKSNYNDKELVKEFKHWMRYLIQIGKEKENNENRSDK